MAKKKKVTERVERPKLNTKEELMHYIERAPDELPFVEEVWQKAVAKAEENKTLPPPIRTKTVVDEFGNKTTVKEVAGARATDPISVYWSYMNLPQYRKKAEEIALENEFKDKCLVQAENSYSNDIISLSYEEYEPQQYNEILAWIDMFPILDERNYLKQRYEHYYDNYEINDGADRTMLSGILSLEIELHRINIRRAKGQAIDIGREEKLRKMLRESLEAQKWTKKQRSAMDDMAQNAFTIWMEKQSTNGRFTPEHHEIDKDEIDFLMETIPEAMRKMFD